MACVKFIVLAVIMTFSIHQASAIKCFVCDTQDQKACVDPMKDLTLLQDCPTDNCVKLDHGVSNGKANIIRSCADTQNVMKCKSAAKQGKGSGTTCDLCEGEACNSAVQNGAVALLMVIPAAFTTIYPF